MSIASEQRDGGRACEDSTWSVADRRVFDLTAASDSDDGWPRPIVAMNVGLAVADDPTLDAAQIVHEADKAMYRTRRGHLRGGNHGQAQPGGPGLGLTSTTNTRQRWRSPEAG